MLFQPRLLMFSMLLATMLMATMLLAPLVASTSQEVSTPSQEASTAGANRSDEPLIGQFSLQRALSFSDTASLQWQQQRDCVTCHTNGLYLVAAARVAPASVGNRRARQFARGYLKRYVVEKQKPSGPRGAVEGLVATTCFLAISDIRSDGKLSTETRKALDHMWSLQDEDGGWSAWLKCGWPPFESDDHFGVTLAAVAAGVLPQSYRETDGAAAGIQRLRGWLRDHPPRNLHHKGMMLWAASGLVGLVEDETQQKWSRELLAAQRPDGGWRLVDVGAGKWKRSEEIAEKLPSDAYATAFSIFALRQAGIAVDQTQLQRGLQWLRSSQRESGRWFSRSPKRDGKHYISHAATMFAILAFHSCGEEL
ncbi:MAG: terpene cyclase/mutase family protein [Planctomycetota bacterium]|nr:terpene cyclase/mutase family protein [Planctomycetota bacterium]